MEPWPMQGFGWRGPWPKAEPLPNRGPWQKRDLAKGGLGQRGPWLKGALAKGGLGRRGPLPNGALADAGLWLKGALGWKGPWPKAASAEVSIGRKSKVLNIFRYKAPSTKKIWVNPKRRLQLISSNILCNLAHCRNWNKIVSLNFQSCTCCRRFYYKTFCRLVKKHKRNHTMHCCFHVFCTFNVAFNDLIFFILAIFCSLNILGEQNGYLHESRDMLQFKQIDLWCIWVNLSCNSTKLI